MNKVGVQSEGWYHDSDPLASLAYIKSCGFDAIDFNINRYVSTPRLAEEGLYPNLFDRSREELIAYFTPLKQAAEQTGVSISQMHAPYPSWFSGAEEANGYLLSVLDKCFAVAEYLGCPAVVVHPSDAPDRSHAAEWEINLAHYRSLIPLIRQYHGVKVCLENLFSYYRTRVVEGRLSNASDVCRMVDLLNEEAGGDYFGFCFDVGHAILTGRNIRDFIREVGHRLTILHLHDNNGLFDLHMIPYSYVSKRGVHICDWKGLIDGLREIGYTGALSFETFSTFQAYPEAVHTEVLKLISAIGRHWASELAK